MTFVAGLAELEAEGFCELSSRLKGILGTMKIIVNLHQVDMIGENAAKASLWPLLAWPSLHKCPGLVSSPTQTPGTTGHNVNAS